MLLAWLLAIAVGAVLGYVVAQRAARNYWQKKLDQDLALLQAELDASKQMVLQLRQESADLRYQIGEADKARRYAEQRLADRGDAS
jgi:uncharacterized membrane-anchored protein YhcB (DUF1043 family)